MATQPTVDAIAICGHSLPLFASQYNAWGHMRDHALGMQHAGEEHGWGQLLPALKIELDSGMLPDLRIAARAINFDDTHPRLGPIYGEFLDSIKNSVEKAVRLNWYWEETTESGIGWTTFGHEGIVAHLDDSCVRTGYILERDRSKWNGGGGDGFRSFQACLPRVQAKFQRAVKSGRIRHIQPALASVLKTGLTNSEWAALA
jgi:hypothetical protein